MDMKGRETGPRFKALDLFRLLHQWNWQFPISSNYLNE